MIKSQYYVSYVFQAPEGGLTFGTDIVSYEGIATVEKDLEILRNCAYRGACNLAKQTLPSQAVLLLGFSLLNTEGTYDA